MTTDASRHIGKAQRAISPFNLILAYETCQVKPHFRIFSWSALTTPHPVERRCENVNIIRNFATNRYMRRSAG